MACTNLSQVASSNNTLRLRRSLSDNHLCNYSIKASSSMVQPKQLKNSRSSVGLFNIQLPLKSFLFETEMRNNNMEEESDDDDEDEIEIKKRVNWIERLVELRNNWKQKQDHNVVEEYDYDEEGGCDVEYEEDEEISIDRDVFSSLLSHVSWSDTKLFSQLAFLCNMAYVIPDIKTEDLRRYYGLEFVTSSLEKKAEAAAIKDKLDHDSTRVPPIIRPSAEAYNEIAASAASYVQSRANDGSEMAACVAASTMTAVVAAGEEQKEKAAKDLQSLHSSPCDWFVCDNSTIYTRCFVIQGSDSLASWQANLFFEPIKFEGTNVLVHRGIYEAAKGIYDQFMPEIKQHIDRFGDRAKLQFTGHSLGGSLALLVNLMLLMRNDQVKASSLLPVVTFGSPFVFCGGEKILDELGVDENHVHCVMMHRDIVPRAFSCNYPTYVAQVLKRLNATFRNHPCLNKQKLLYSPMGKIFILQPDDKSSPGHPLLPPGSALYALNKDNVSLTKIALRAFLNSPHPIETLSDPMAYGSEGTILRDHDSSNYLKAVNQVIRRHTRFVVRKARKQRNELWPLLTSRSPHAWTHTYNKEGVKKILTGV